MSPGPDVVAFVGPSLTSAEAAAILPAARLEPPVRRGDLYRARNDGAAVLLIIDGQFLQEEALPVREVVDVARDGAAVFGAASMGALRAAECWPVGVRGVGLVYRLFRAGRLRSDDEVAVAADPDDRFRATSVALVNIRVALRRAARAGLIERPVANAVAEQAARVFYPERTWAEVWRTAGPAADPGLAHFCAAIDVKRDDAQKLLQTVAALAADAEFHADYLRRPSSAPLAERERQRLPDPLAGHDREVLAAVLARWLLGSGRHRPNGVPMAFTPLGAWTRMNVEEPGFAKWLWEELAATGDLEAEVMRMQAVELATSEVAARGLRVRAVDRYLAEADIAARYRCTSRAELQRVAQSEGVPWSWVEEAMNRLALARRRREELFNPPPAR